MGLHGVPGCSSRQSWPPLWIVSVCVTQKAQHGSLSLRGCFNPPSLSPASPHPPSAYLSPIDSIRDITGTEKNCLKNQQHSSSL